VYEEGGGLTRADRDGDDVMTVALDSTLPGVLGVDEIRRYGT
jgi:hypothetical protein